MLKLIDGGGDLELRRGRWLMGDSKDRENKPIKYNNSRLSNSRKYN